MSELLAVAFDDPHAADEVLARLRGAQSEHLIELEDAATLQVDAGGRLHLRQAIGHGLPEALTARFWHDLILHLVHHGRETGAGGARTPLLGLERAFADSLAGALQPSTSVLCLMVRREQPGALLRSLEQHRGRILRSGLSGEEQEALEVALGMRAPRPLDAAGLRILIAGEQRQEAAAVAEKRATTAARQQQEIERLRRRGLGPENVRAILERCTDAARAGQSRVIAYTFPSEVCLDGGRAINNTEPDWPEQLTGQPRAVYEYWRDTLRPAGYHLSAETLNFPGGMPGDVGFFLSWAG